MFARRRPVALLEFKPSSLAVAAPAAVRHAKWLHARRSFANAEPQNSSEGNKKRFRLWLTLVQNDVFHIIS